jgi:drug/metabolite transporter (DMT)-like permease
MGSLVGFTAYAFLLRNTRAAVATSYAYINPVVAIVLGIALGGEHLDGASIAGGAIVLAAVLLVLQGRRAKEAAPKELETRLGAVESHVGIAAR